MKRLIVTLLTALVATGFALGQGVSVWTHFGETDLEWLQGQAESFEAAFGVPVEVTRIELGEIKQKMLLSAPQGEAADLVMPIPHDQLGEMAAAGVLADMTTFATGSYLEDLTEQARLAFTFNGKLFGLPMFVEGPALIVNTDLVPQVPATYEELIATAEELTTADTFGFLYDVANFYFAYNWIHSGGGYVFDRNAQGDLMPTELGLATEGAVRGATMIRDLMHEHGLIPPGTNTEVTQGLFNEGALGMMYNGPWAIPAALDAGISVTVAPMPPMADGTEWSGFMGVQGVLMNEFSNAKTPAANFAKWLTRPQAQVELAQRSGRIPTSRTAAAQVSDDPVIAGFAAALANAEPMPNIPQMGNVWQPMADALSLILEGPDSDVDQILERAAQQIQGN